MVEQLELDNVRPDSKAARIYTSEDYWTLRMKFLKV
jgi:hypothetical protein